MDTIQVFGEIGKLRKVLLHRPGKELERLAPDFLSELLFDDIPFLDAAQEEHDAFADVLRKQGVEVLYLADLAEQTLCQSDDIKLAFVRDLIAQSGSLARYFMDKHALCEYLMGLDTRELVEKSMAGLTIHDFHPDYSKGGHKIPNGSVQFLLYPMPNLYFTRDPFSSVGNGVALSHMRFPTRERETIYSRYIFKHHPDFKDVKTYYENTMPFHLEGGDVLNLNEHVLAVGMSQRSSPDAAEMLASRIFADPNSPMDTVLVFDIPDTRAYMHLDTVFTQVDVGKFTIHASIQKDMRIFVLQKKGDKGDYTVHAEDMSLEKILEKYLGVPVTLIPCGNRDSLASAREQWNDAANTLAIAPGVVVCYNRNKITNEALEESGVTVFRINSSELSRGRGGPRCMSMPLIRDR